MKKFDFINAQSVDDASNILAKENAVVLAGGTDLLGVLKDKLLPVYPEKVVNLKNIEGLKGIEKTKDGLTIKANTTLTELAQSSDVQSNWQALADAAYSVASPNIRNAATIAGNICQDVRCWYYRYPHVLGGRIDCMRKEGSLCSAVMGENRYHSIFGGMPVNTSPCTTYCPAGTDISSYMEEMRAGDMDAAAEIILRVNPMSALTSRICPHFCQSGCNRTLYDESVNISSVERTLGDYILANHEKFMKAPSKENGKKVAIIGSGPAGLVAAYYLRESGYAVTIYEKSQKAGGCLMYAIPPYRLPKDLVQQYMDIIAGMGVKFVFNTEIGKDITIDELKDNNDQVLLGIGTWDRPFIGIKGEDKTQFGLDFLVESNTGNDTKPGDHVIVIGGGNVAMDVAMNSKRLGAKNVTLYCLESREHMPANVEEVEMALEEGIIIENGWGPIEVTDDQITLRKCMQVNDASGMFCPLYDDDNTITVNQDAVFMAVGQRGNVDNVLLKNKSVEVENGRIKLNDMKTTDEKIFVGGDVAYGPATVIKAVAHGKKIAKAINERVGNEPLVIEKVDAAVKEKNALKFKSNVEAFYAQNKKEMPAVSDRKMYAEDTETFSTEKTGAEINRCFNCGCVAVNPSDVANMLYAYGATITTNMRTLSSEEFFARHADMKRVLKPGEIVTEIFVPTPELNSVDTYTKYRLRKSIDFAVLALATNYVVKDGVVEKASIVMGAVAPMPVKALDAENYLVGKKLTDEVIAETAEIALKGAIKLKDNAYKISMAKEYIVRSLEALQA